MSDNSAKKSNWRRKYRLFKQQEDRQEFEGWTESDFIKHIFELREEIGELEEELKELASQSTQDMSPVEKEAKSIKTEDFKPDWPYSTKFVFLLLLENKPLTSREIHEHLLRLDKQYQFYNDPKGTLSVYLRAVAKSGRIKSIKLPGIKEKLFAMPEWVDSEEKLVAEFQIPIQFK